MRRRVKREVLQTAKILFSEYGKTDFIYIELHFFADPTNFLACIKNVKGEGGLEVEN